MEAAHIGLWVTAGKFTHSGLEIPWNVSLVLGTLWWHKFDWSPLMTGHPKWVNYQWRRDIQQIHFYIQCSSWMNSETFANRLLLGLSVLWFQSDIIRNIHKETTFRLFCDSTLMNSEIFTKRLLLGLSTLWFQSYEFRNIHKETTFQTLFCNSNQMNSEIFTKRLLFRTLCSVTTVRWIQKYSQRLFLGLCSVIPVTSVQKYSQRDYFSDSVLWFESDEFRNIHTEITFRTLFCYLNQMNEFRNIHKEITFRTLCSVLLWLIWYVQLRHSRHSLSFAC